MSYHTPWKKLSRDGEREVAYMEAFAKSFLTFAGETELVGEPYEISKWAHDHIWKPLFGTGRVDERGRWTRQYRRVLLGVHRAFGKSQLAAVLLMTVATMEPVRNGVYGIIADGKTNTTQVKNYIKAMIETNPTLKAVWKVNKDEIINRETGQEIHVYPYKESAVQSRHYVVLICDEVHMWRDDAVWNGAVSGAAKIRNALLIGITTAGSSRDGFLFKLYRKLKADTRAYVCWLGISDSDKVTDRRSWKKITAAGRITMEELEEQYEGGTPASFERYYLNRTPMDETEEPFMRRADVAACQKVERKIDYSKWFTVGIDGAVNGDTLAMVAAQRQGDGWAFDCWAWEKPGAMGTHDLLDVADVLQDVSSRGEAPLAVVDPARMQLFTNTLYRDRGIALVDMPQTPKTMCPASELLAYAVRKHAAAFGGGGDMEVLAQRCVNARVDESKAYGRRITSERHGRGSKRIDAAIAAAMAMYAYDNNEPELPSVYTIEL